MWPLPLDKFLDPPLALLMNLCCPELVSLVCVPPPSGNSPVYSYCTTPIRELTCIFILYHPNQASPVHSYCTIPTRELTCTFILYHLHQGTHLYIHTVPSPTRELTCIFILYHPPPGNSPVHSYCTTSTRELTCTFILYHPALLMKLCGFSPPALVSLTCVQSTTPTTLGNPARELNPSKFLCMSAWVTGNVRNSSFFFSRPSDTCNKIVTSENNGD